jgi:hypothetical protein
MTQFDTAYKAKLNESLLEGQADYSDVLDVLKKLETKVQEFTHVYPMSRGTHIHAAYKAEIERMANRLDQWIKAQNKFVQQKKSDTEVPTKSP